MIYLTKEQKNKYKVMSRPAAEKYCTQKHDKTALMISIRSTWDNVMPNVFGNAENKVLHILSLALDDIDMEDDPQFAMNAEQGKLVAQFINDFYDKVDRIIVHCDGGISRSAGVAAAIMRVKEHEDYPLFDSHKKHPNMTCYLMTLKGFGYI